MNKFSPERSLSIELPPVDENLQKFVDLTTRLDSMLLSGHLSYPIVLEGLHALLKGENLIQAFPVWKTLVMREKFRAPPTSRRGPSISSALIEYYRIFMMPRYKIRAGVEFFYSDSVESRSFEEAFKAGKREVDLTRVSPQRVGFTNTKGVRLDAFYARASEVGLEKCWPEIGFALRFAYIDQPCGEWLTIAADISSVHVPGRVLRVGRGREEDPLCLEPRVVSHNTRIPLNEEWVFVEPRRE